MQRNFGDWAALLLVIALLMTCTTAAAAAPAPQVTSAETTADALAAALGSSDLAALERLISPSGFNWAMEGGQGARPRSPQEAVEFLRTESGGRLQVSVNARPLRPSPVPWGTQSIDSVWRAFGNVPEQNIVLVLQDLNAKWYWAGGYIVTSARTTVAPTTPQSLPPTTTAVAAAGTASSSQGAVSTSEGTLSTSPAAGNDSYEVASDRVGVALLVALALALAIVLAVRRSRGSAG